MGDGADANSDAEIDVAKVQTNGLPGHWEMHDWNKNDTLNLRNGAHNRDGTRRVWKNPRMAIQLPDRGDLTESHRLWRYHKSLPDTASRSSPRLSQAYWID